MQNKIVSEPDKKIGENIARCRSLAGMNQEALGIVMRPPVKYQQISKFEHGYNRISATQLVDMARAFGCRVADLLVGVDPIIAEEGGFAETITKQEGELVAGYRQIRNPEMQKLVRTLCRALITETANNLRA